MATVSSIGTSSRTYSTVSAWLVAFAIGGWEGELYNDSQFSAGGSFTGHAVNASDYIELRCATGQSFKDNANVQTNALAYDATKGVSFTSVNTALFTFAENFVTLKSVQAQMTGTSSAVYAVINNTTALNSSVLDNCILESASTINSVIQWRSGLVRNCLLVTRTSTAVNGVTIPTGGSSTPTFVNVTVVRPSSFTLGAAAFNSGTNSITLKNCAGFGYSNFTAGTGTFSGSNNASDQTIGFGTSNQASKTYANQFVTTADTSRDFKAKTGADLVDTGVTDTTDIPSALDIAGTSRPQGSAWDIGAWELVAAGAANQPHRLTCLGVG